MNLKVSCAIAAVLALSACGGGGGNANGTTFFSTPDGSGNFENDFEENIRRGGLVDGDGDGFAYEFGSNGTDGFRATAGLLSTTEFGSPPPGGFAVYEGQYRFIEATDIAETETEFSATSIAHGGSIVLIGDFMMDKLTGIAPADDLEIEADIVGNTLSGTATFAGMVGELRGGIDREQTVGAFHGNQGDSLFAGGFIADSRQ